MLEIAIYGFAVVGFAVTAIGLWQKLDGWLDGFQGVVFVPEEKAQELEQHLWGNG